MAKAPGRACPTARPTPRPVGPSGTNAAKPFEASGAAHIAENEKRRTSRPSPEPCDRFQLSCEVLLIDVLSAAGYYSQLKRKLPPNHPRVIEAHRRLVAARLRVHVADLMATSPALTDSQVEDIAALLRGRQ